MDGSGQRTAWRRLNCWVVKNGRFCTHKKPFGLLVDSYHDLLKEWILIKQRFGQIVSTNFLNIFERYSLNNIYMEAKKKSRYIFWIDTSGIDIISSTVLFLINIVSHFLLPIIKNLAFGVRFNSSKILPVLETGIVTQNFYLWEDS